jgi:hypothetical protein
MDHSKEGQRFRGSANKKKRHFKEIEREPREALSSDAM